MTIVMTSMPEFRSKAQQELASIRDMVESIWVAIVLAFVLRAFVVEAFVIPTGSMAPRLLGEHFDLQCSACGYRYAFGWSSDAERAGARFGGRAGGQSPGAERVFAAASCPNCGHDRSRGDVRAGGDRVLVMKYLYRFREPEPWDVVVFKNPQDNRQNYIKRLIGLPGETIEIVRGDVFVSHDRGKSFRIRRKARRKTQQAMWQVVYDNDYYPQQDRFGEHDPSAGEEGIRLPFWAPADARARGLWGLSNARGRRFVFRGTASGPEAELNFRCGPDSFLPLYGYNPYLNLPDGSTSKWPELLEMQMNYVSDLNLSVTYVPHVRDSRITLTLACPEHVFQAAVGARGTAELRYRRSTDAEDAPWTLWAKTDKLPAMALGRGCEVSLTHVDLRVSLWIDGKEVLRSRDRNARAPAGSRLYYPLDYGLVKAQADKMASENARLRERLDKMADDNRLPGRAELERLIKERFAHRRPNLRIGAAGGRCELWHVKLLRDVHYTCPKFGGPPVRSPSGAFAHRQGVAQSDDPGWGTMGHPIVLRKYSGNHDLDQYFVLGDNSPSSLDGRLWSSAAVTLRLYDEDGTIGDPRLAVGDIHWGPFLAELRRQAGAAGPSPGKRIWQRLPEELRAKLAQFTVGELDSGYDPVGEELKRRALRELNGMLGRALYEPQAWQAVGIELPAKARALAERAAGQKLPAEESEALDRLALEAAFAGAVETRWRIYQLGTVPRYSLIGKAVFVYWPAGFRLPGLARLPILPNVGRMRLIR